MADIVTKMRRQHAEDVKRIAALEAQIAQAEVAATYAVQQAITATTGPLQAIIARHEAHKNAHWVEWKPNPDDVARLASLFNHDLARPTSTNGEIALANALHWAVEQLAAGHDLLNSRTHSMNHRMGVMQITIDEQRAALAAAEPKIAAAENQVLALTALLDKLRDRMTKKDREAEAAILNRRALAGARPGENRR